MPPAQMTENILSYHDIVANSIRAIVNALATGQLSQAKKIIKFNIQQAYTLWYMQENPDADPEEVY
ncbi:hypothetical protein GWN43_03055, partial [Candidatus Bathyarchaeota archaeon]|nr:hypothetical protein [Candidatus Bathyarchaeota archaeon]